MTPRPTETIPSQPLWEIKSSPIHGTGLFARVDLTAGLRLIEYVGRKITKRESLALCQKNNPYIFFLNEQWDLDGNTENNPARFSNHSCDPNCEVEQEGDRIWIVSLRPVRAGEELTYDYGYDLEDYHNYPCHCGSPHCVGFIVAGQFRSIVAKSQASPIPVPCP
jgi:SET domain-containing protein